ncbi:MAG: hypothetical protein PVI86_13095, partial [Phycisphaerae bacterium]|jgi:hypothetical protein
LLNSMSSARHYGRCYRTAPAIDPCASELSGQLTADIAGGLPPQYSGCSEAPAFRHPRPRAYFVPNKKIEWKSRFFRCDTSQSSIS